MLATSAQQAATGNNCYVPEGSAGLGNANPDPSDTFCSTANSYEANYFNQYWRLAPTPSPTDFIHITMEFVAKPDLSLIFACDFADLAIDALGALDPETIPEDIGLEEGINLVCEDQEANMIEKSTTDEA
ncbi:hypothetical protein G7Y89_g9285 [Cudoniella acicularis]|uniref:Uncharacterized protein n=1 Tax=Cudoniella acicularis TaxID=354080 RepID=A0A8H4RHA0_9HELO|nr:hypothetical protein G7Y89_g9285 [Cudoniella acicularis]